MGWLSEKRNPDSWSNGAIILMIIVGLALGLLFDAIREFGTRLMYNVTCFTVVMLIIIIFVIYYIRAKDDKK